MLRNDYHVFVSPMAVAQAMSALNWLKRNLIEVIPILPLKTHMQMNKVKVPLVNTSSNYLIRNLIYHIYFNILSHGRALHVKILV